VERSLGGLIGSITHHDSTIHLLATDLDRGFNVAAASILHWASGANRKSQTQICYRCSSTCSLSLAVCPNCRAQLIVEPLKETTLTSGGAVPAALSYCPLCDTEYDVRFDLCTICGVGLVPEEMRGRMRPSESSLKIASSRTGSRTGLRRSRRGGSATLWFPGMCLPLEKSCGRSRKVHGRSNSQKGSLVGQFYHQFCCKTPTDSWEVFRSLPQWAQNLSSSPTSSLQWGQEGCRLHLQLGQKLKRAFTVVAHSGQG